MQGRFCTSDESPVVLSLLILEDDTQVAASLERALRAHGYDVQVALNAQAALEIARTRPLDLILCDVRMPGMDGLDALASLRTLQEGVRSIVMTGYASEDTPIRAIQNGVDDYLLKPVQLDKLLASIARSAELCRVEKEARRALEEMRLRYLRLITSVVSLFWDRDRWFFEHSRRVAALAVDVGTELGLLPVQLDQLELAALLHDLGMVFADRGALLSERVLTEDERLALQACPEQLRELLDETPDLREIKPLLLHLREHYDGTGYPGRLAGQAIPLGARILAACEAWDSLRHERPHRAALSFEEAAAVMEGSSQFDPALVAVLLGLARDERSAVDPRRLALRAADTSSWRTLLRLGALLAGSDRDAARQALMEAGERHRTLYGGDSLEVLAELAALEAESRPEEALRWLGRARMAPEMGSASPAVLQKLASALRRLGRVGAAAELEARLPTVPAAVPVVRPAPIPSELQVLAFGPPTVRGAGPWPSRKALELFFYLVVAGRPVSQDQLAEALWGEASRKNVNTTVSRARQALRGWGRPVIVLEHSFLRVEGVECDVHRFDALSRAGQVSEAVALYRADLLEGTWWEWADEPRRAYREKAFGLMLGAGLASEREGNLVAATGFYGRVVELDASREDGQVGLMRCLCAQGQREAAVRRYHEYCRVLAKELGLSPGPAAVALYEELCRN